MGQHREDADCWNGISLRVSTCTAIALSSTHESLAKEAAKPTTMAV